MAVRHAKPNQVGWLVLKSESDADWCRWIDRVGENYKNYAGRANMTYNRKYIELEPNQKQGYPIGKNIYYECLICGAIVESRPEHFAECKCQNITVDTAAGRLSVTDPTKFRVFKDRP